MSAAGYFEPDNSEALLEVLVQSRKSTSSDELRSAATQRLANESTSLNGDAHRGFLSRGPEPLRKVYWDNYVWLMLSASVGFALTQTCMKLLLNDFSVFQVAFVRSLLCFTTLVWMSRKEGVSFLEPRDKIGLMIGRGIAGAVAFLFLSVATFELPLSESAFMTNSYPVVAAVLSWVLGMERLGAWSWTGITGCVIGNALMAHPPFVFGHSSEWGTKRLIGIASALLGNFCTSISFILIRTNGETVSSTTLTGYMHFFGMFVSAPFLLLQYPKPIRFQASSLHVFCYATIYAMGVFAQVVQSRSLQIGPPSKTTSLLMTNMLLTAFFGVVFFSESLSWSSGIGAGIIVCFVMLVTMQNPEKRVPNRPGSYQTLIHPTEQSGRDIPTSESI